MSDLVVIVPSRGRPANARRFRDAWQATADGCDLWFAVDQTDPELIGYNDLAPHLMFCQSDGMPAALNEVANRAIVSARPYIGFCGDDHLPRTPHWDRHIIEALARLGTGIVYGNDLMQHGALPTAVFMTADIVAALGYMCPPRFRHLYLDNCWKAWGEGIGRIRYLPDVVIEHLHPQAGKSEWDDGYRRVNAGDVWAHDAQQWDLYRSGQLFADLAKLRALLDVREPA